MSDVTLKSAYRLTNSLNVLLYITTLVFVAIRSGNSWSIYSLMLISLMTITFCYVNFLPSRYGHLYLRLFEGTERRQQRLLFRCNTTKHILSEYFLDDAHCYISPLGVFLRFLKQSETKTQSIEEQVHSKKLGIALIVEHANKLMKNRWYSQDISVFIPKYQLDTETYRKMCRILLWH